MRNAVSELAPPPVVIENAPASVEVVLRSQQQGRRRLLHLVNFTGEMTRPIQKIVPLRDVRITLTGGAGVRRVHTLVTPRRLPFEKDQDGRLRVVLPGMAEYEVVVFEQ